MKDLMSAVPGTNIAIIAVSPRNMQALWKAGCWNIFGLPSAVSPTICMSYSTYTWEGIR